MPIRAVMIAGGIFSAAAVVWFIVIIVSKLSGNIDVPGYSALSVIMLLGFGLLFIFQAQIQSAWQALQTAFA